MPYFLLFVYCICLFINAMFSSKPIPFVIFCTVRILFFISALFASLICSKRIPHFQFFRLMEAAYRRPYTANTILPVLRLHRMPPPLPPAPSEYPGGAAGGDRCDPFSAALDCPPPTPKCASWKNRSRYRAGWHISSEWLLFPAEWDQSPLQRCSQPPC